MFSFKNFLMATLLILAASILETAEAAIVTDKMPLQCYVDHKVTSYDKNNGREVGWIDAEVDLVEIKGINASNGVALGTHPSGSRRVERIFWARDVFADLGYRNRNVHVSGSHQVYRTKSSGATIGSISNEEVTVVADNGNRAQIVYRLNNGTGYKMGWVPSSIVAANQPVGANFKIDSYNLTCPSDHKLRFTGRVWNENDNSEITGVHVYIGGGVGAGGEFMGEFRSDSNHNFDKTLNVPQHRNGNQLIVIYAVNGKDAGELNRTNINVSGGSQPTTGVQRSPSGLIYPLGSRHRLVGADDQNNGKNHDHTRDCCTNAGLGTPVYAIADGEVRYYAITGYTHHTNGEVLVSYGNVAYFVGDNGFGAVYAHLSSFEGISTPYGGDSSYPAFQKHKDPQKQCWGITRHKIGIRRVKAGDVIGKVGNSGNSKGVHLHFELYNNAYFTANGKVSGTRLEPNNYFNQ